MTDLGWLLARANVAMGAGLIGAVIIGHDLALGSVAGSATGALLVALGAWMISQEEAA